MKPKLGFAWYRKEQWDRLLAVSSDRDCLEETYEGWLVIARKSFDEFKRAGNDVYRVDVDVEELIRWCQKRKRPIDGKARSEFAVHKLQIHH